jgi:hypothetical protein
MAEPISAPQPYFPQIDKSVPPEITVHLQRLYPAINNHDQAIVTLKSQLDTAIAAAKNTTSTNTVITITSAVTAFAGIGTVNNQAGAISYTTQTSDNGTLLWLDDASPIAITLNSVVTTPYFLFTTNIGAGTATFTPTSGKINSAASYALAGSSTAILVFDGVNWWATAVPVIVPLNTPAVLHEWLASYNAATGAFTQAQPAVGDVTGAAPLASPTFTGKVTTPILANTATQTPVAASGSGTVTFSQPEQGSSYKKVMIYLNAATGTASYNFPTVFTYTPMVLSQSLAATVTTLSASAVTVTGSASTGFVALEGY